MHGDGLISVPAAQRAEELIRMLTDPGIRAVVPPWGGELAVELLLHLDMEAIASADPTWFVGYSDISTLLLPPTAMTRRVVARKRSGYRDGFRAQIAKLPTGRITNPAAQMRAIHSPVAKLTHSPIAKIARLYTNPKMKIRRCDELT